MLATILRIWLLTLGVVALAGLQAYVLTRILPNWAEWPVAIALSLELVLVMYWLVTRLHSWIGGSND